jgi:hypothetical protein
VGDTADTAEFAVESIRRWWNQLGQARFPEATTLMITADAGGSIGPRVRGLEVLAASLGRRDRAGHHCLTLPARHLQMDKLEHRLYSFISLNWRGRALTNMRTIVWSPCLHQDRPVGAMCL